MARDFSHRPPRGVAYHESAIKYNEVMAKCARELSNEVEDKEVKRWCRSIARQHDEHTVNHQKVLDRLLKQKARKQKLRQKKTRERTNSTENKNSDLARPIPRDPRGPKKIFTNNPITKDAVGTNMPEHLSLGDEKQETSV